MPPRIASIIDSCASCFSSLGFSFVSSTTSYFLTTGFFFNYAAASWSARDMPPSMIYGLGTFNSAFSHESPAGVYFLSQLSLSSLVSTFHLRSLYSSSSLLKLVRFFPITNPTKKMWPTASGPPTILCCFALAKHASSCGYCMY